MNLDLGTLCLLGIFLIVGVLLVSRLFGGRSQGAGYGGTDFSQRGPEESHIDSPDVQSRGAFGRPAGRSILPSSLRRGGSSGSGSAFGSRPSSSSSGRADSPETKSRGSFGRSKR